MALTPKQEKFCQKYIETGNASEAYRLAYNAKKMKLDVIHVKACELLKSGNVAVRVASLRAIHAKRHEVTIDSITLELEEARILAKDEKQAAPMVSASLGKAKLHGLVVEKNEHSGPNGGPIATTNKSDDELNRRILELAAKAGAGRVAGAVGGEKTSEGES